MYRRLVIGGQECDLPKGDFPLSLVYEISESGIVSAPRAKRSIELPATSNNDAIFEDWGAISNLNPNASVFKPFTFEDKGVTLLTGNAQLQSSPLMSNRYGFKAASYKVDLYGGNADWFFLLKNKYLKDLPFDDKVYDTGQVIGGQYADYDSGDFFGFTLIKTKEWKTPGEVDIDEFTPFIFIRSFLDLIFDSIGYTMESNFIDTDVFKKLIMPLLIPKRYNEEFSNDYLNVTLEQPLHPSAGTIAFPYLFPSQTKTPSNGNPWNSGTGEYAVPFTGYYQVSALYDMLNVTASSAFDLGLSIDGATPDIILFGTMIMADQTFQYTSPVLFLNAGQTISFALVNSVGGYDEYIEINIIGEAEVAFGSILAWKYLIGNGLITDFILGLQHLFNLRFETDTREQVVYFETADRSIIRSRATLTTATQTTIEGFYRDNLGDDTPRLDLQKSAELYNDCDQSEIVTLDYITEGDTEEYLQTETLGIYAANYRLPENKYNQSVEVKENPFFAKTIHTIDNSIRGTGFQISVQLPLIYNQNYRLDPTSTEAPEDITPRILYFAGIRIAGFFDGWDGKVNFTFAPGLPLPYPKSFMVNYVSNLDFSLSFASETIGGVRVPGLMECFWLQEFSRRRVAKRLECAIAWDSLEILALSFRDKLNIAGRKYVLAKVDGFQPLNDSSTKTILRLDNAPEQEDDDAIENTILLGTVSPEPE